MRCRLSRKYSLTNRFNRLRITALPTFLVTVIPSRDLSASFNAKRMIKCRSRTCFPFRDNRRNSFRFRSLSAFFISLSLNLLPFYLISVDRRAQLFLCCQCHVMRQLMHDRALYSQTFTAFRPAAVDYIAAVFSRHTF